MMGYAKFDTLCYSTDGDGGNYFVFTGTFHE